MRDIFIKDFGWKLLSVCVAVVIWLTVHKILSETPDTSPEARVSTLIYSNLPVRAVSSIANVSGYQLDPAMVEVTLTGPANVMAQLEEAEIQTTVDLTEAATNKLSHAKVLVSPPRGVMVFNVSPEEIRIHPPAKPLAPLKN